MTRTPPKTLSFPAAAALALAAVLCYLHVLDAPFVFDDHKDLLAAPAIRMERPTPGAVWDALRLAPSPTRPVANLSFALNHWLHGYRRPGYRVVNVAVHVAAGLLLMVFVRLTLVAARPHLDPPRARSIAFFTALIWTVHPLHIQSVTYIVQRMNALAAMFYLAAMVAYIRARYAQRPAWRAAWAAVAVLAGLCAVGSKENAATLPLFVLLYEWFFFQRLRPQWLCRHRALLAAAPLAFAALAFVYLGPHPLRTLLALYDHYPFTVGERLLTEARVVWYYLGLILLPLPGRLNLDHHVAVSTGLLDPWTTLPAVAGLVAVLPLAAATARRRPLAAFLVAWYFGNLAIESSIIGPELIFEHRTYLPSMAVVFGLTTVLFDRPAAARLAPIVAAALVLVLAGWTLQRNAVWNDRVALWRDAVAKAPRNPRAHNNLAKLLYERGDLEGAITHAVAALRLNPGYAMAASNLGAALAARGDTRQAMAAYRAALALRPDLAQAHGNLAALLFRQGRQAEAVARYEEALRLEREPGLLVNYGLARLKMEDAAGAARLFAEALARAPHHPVVRRHRALIAATLRRPADEGPSPCAGDR